MSLLDQGRTDQKYQQSVLEFNKLLDSLRQLYLRYSGDASDAKQINLLSENDDRIFVAGVCSVEDQEANIQKWIDQITVGESSIQCRSWDLMPTALLFPLLQGHHWRAFVVHVDYDSLVVTLTFDDPQGAGLFPEDLKVDIQGVVYKIVYSLIIQEKNAEAFSVTLNITDRTEDQQGKLINTWDSAPIVLSNIEDQIKFYSGKTIKLSYQIPGSDRPSHQDIVGQVRSRDVQRYKRLQETEIKNNKELSKSDDKLYKNNKDLPKNDIKINTLQNAFNQMENKLQNQSITDIDFIAKQILKNLRNESIIQIGDWLSSEGQPKQDKNYIIIYPQHSLVGVQNCGGQWVCQLIKKVGNNVTVKYKNSLGYGVKDLEGKVKKVQGIVTNVELREPQMKEQFDRSSSGVFALTNLISLINNSNFYKPKDNEGVLKTRIELGYLYLQFIQGKHSRWYEASLDSKEKLLREAIPLTIYQFQLISGNNNKNNAEIELKELLKAAIIEARPLLAKRILKTNIKINDGIIIEKQSISFLTLLDGYKDNLDLSGQRRADRQKIKLLLIKQGCTANIDIKEEDMTKIQTKEDMTKIQTKEDTNKTENNIKLKQIVEWNSINVAKLTDKNIQCDQMTYKSIIKNQKRQINNNINKNTQCDMMPHHSSYNNQNIKLGNKFDVKINYDENCDYMSFSQEYQIQTYKHNINNTIKTSNTVNLCPTTIVKNISDAGKYVNTKNIHGWTPLHIAAQEGSLEVVGDLIIRGLLINAKDREGQTPLHFASIQGHFEVVELLLQRHADVNDAASNGQTPLHLASQKGFINIIKELISKGADVSAIDKKKFTPLHQASQEGQVEAVIELIMKNSQVNAISKKGQTPLHIASQNGHVEVVRGLMIRGANVNAQDKSGYSSLHIASLRGYLEVIVELVQRGANMNIIDDKGYAPLHLASQEGHVEVVRQLVVKGANVKATVGPLGLTPLEASLMYKKLTTAIFLLKIQAEMSWELNEHEESVFKQFNPSQTIDATYVNMAILKLQQKNYDFEQYRSDFNQLPTQDVTHQNFSMLIISFISIFNLNEDQKLFFQGNNKHADQNRVVRLLIDFKKPNRLDEALQICYAQYQDEHFIFLRGLIYLSKAQNQTSSKAQNQQQLALEVANYLPDSTEKSQLYGEFYFRQDKYEDALSYYKSALKSSPSFNQARVRIASIYLKQDNIQEAGLQITETYEYALSIDVEIMLQDVIDSMHNSDFITSQKVHDRKVEDDYNFLKALNQTLQIDVNYKKKQLLRSLQGQSKAVEIVDAIEYAQDMLDVSLISVVTSFFDSLLDRKQVKINNKDHDIYKKINELTRDLNQLKIDINISGAGSQSQLDNDLKSSIVDVIDKFINQYNEYINKVIENQGLYKFDDYKAELRKGVAKELDVERDVQVLTEKGENYLLSYQASLKLTVKPPKTDQQYGAHTVVVYPLRGEGQIFYKQSPQAPGIEFAVRSLYNKILPNMTPEAMLMKVSKNDDSVIYHASNAIVGRNLMHVINDRHIIGKIDPENFSGLLLGSLLVCPGDAKPDNFIVKFNYDRNKFKSAELVSIDNDIAFCREKLSIDDRNNKVQSDMLNILQLMPQMDDVVNSKIRDKLNKQSPEIMTAEWLNELHEKNRIQEASGFRKSDLDEVRLPIKLPSGTAVRVYSCLKKILRLLKSETTTHNDIFKNLYPGICQQQKKSRDSASVLNSLKNLQAAAGADPNLVNSLQSGTTITSSKAWASLSASKRLDQKTFNDRFNSSIQREAEEFISKIDFSMVGSNVAKIINSHLQFVENLVLNKINEEQFKEIIFNARNIFKSIDLIDTKINDTSWIRRSVFQWTKIYNSQEDRVGDDNTFQNKIEPLNIKSLWDLVDEYKRPQDHELVNGRLMKLIVEEKLEINEEDPQGNTLLHIAAQQNDRLVAKLLLDCGIDKNIKNEEKKRAIDLCEGDYKLSFLILEQKPEQFWRLINQGNFEQAKKIASTTSFSQLTELLDGKLVGGEQSILEKSLQDASQKQLAYAIIAKAKKLPKMDQIHMVVENYEDDNIDLLELILKRDANILTKQNNQNKLAADIALENGKFNMLAQLLNNGSTLSKADNMNIKTILQAAGAGIKIDASDFRNGYNQDKVDQDRNTIFHLMCAQNNSFIFEQKDRIGELVHKNNNDKTLKDLALEHNFIELLEFLYKDLTKQDEEGYHKLAIDQDTRRLSKFLKNHGIEVSIGQARNGVDLNDVTDVKGNTAIQVLVKKIILSDKNDRESITKDILQMLDSGADVNLTYKADKNTALHLASRAGLLELSEKLIGNKQINLGILNSQNQTALDFAVRSNVILAKRLQELMYGASITRETQNLIMRDLKLRNQRDTYSTLSFNIIDDPPRAGFVNSKQTNVAERIRRINDLQECCPSD